MNTPDESQIESILRRAPRSSPPNDLKAALVRQARTAPKAAPVPEPSPATASVLAQARDSWLRRWRPILAPAVFILACAVVLAVQRTQIHELKGKVQALAASVSPDTAAAPKSPGAGQGALDAAASEEEEIARLKEVLAGLFAEMAKIDQLRLENQALRAKLAAPPARFTQEETADMDKAREHAMKIQCINNMKQMGLAVRVWAGDNNDQFPPDIICMSNELNTPKILVCPADPGHTAARDFTMFSQSANFSYEYLGGVETEPTRIMFRCPIHGNLGMCDGSVYGDIGKVHPEWIVQRNGKLYFEQPPRAE